MDHVQLSAPLTSKGKRRKNFLWNLNPEWISGLLQILAEYVDANMRSAQGFKEAIYNGVAQKLKERHGIEVTGEQCKNQIRHQRTIWLHIQELKRKSGVSWDENRKIIIMGNDEYNAHIQAFPKDATFLNNPIANYVELEKVCGEGHATGEWAKSGNSETPFGTNHINLEEDESTNFVGIGIDSLPSTQWPDMEIKEEHKATTMRGMSSSSKVSASRKKSKQASSTQSLGEYISKMADSVTLVANAIQLRTTSAEERERRMFTELMAAIQDIPGFSGEEVDIIYENLSNNPPMIHSFLSRPAESKARWMRKELGK